MEACIAQSMLFFMISCYVQFYLYPTLTYTICTLSIGREHPDLVLTIQVRVELVAKPLAGIIETGLLVKLLNLLHVFGVQLEIALEIGLDARGGLGLWEHRVAL